MAQRKNYDKDAAEAMRGLLGTCDNIRDVLAITEVGLLASVESHDYAKVSRIRNAVKMVDYDPASYDIQGSFEEDLIQWFLLRQEGQANLIVEIWFKAEFMADDVVTFVRELDGAGFEKMAKLVNIWTPLKEK